MLTLEIEDNLKLCLPSKENIDKMFAVVMENYEHLHKWSAWLNEDFSRQSVEEFYDRTLEKFEDGRNTLSLNIIFNGEIVGTIGFHDINEKSKSAEIGYWLAKDQTGKGFVTKAVKRLLNYGFGEMELNRIVIKCVPGNTKSRAVPERLGFTNEGIERESAWLHTRFVDHVVYSMLAREWREKIKG